MILTIVYFSLNNILNVKLAKQKENQLAKDPNFVENHPNYVSRYTIELYTVKIVYNVLIIVLGNFFKKRTYDIVDMNNFPFQQDYDDALITYLFSFNSLNFYLPTLIVAVRSEFDFVDVFTNVLIQMVVNQYIANIQETLAPKWESSERLKTLDQQFNDCLIDSKKDGSKQEKAIGVRATPDKDNFVAIDDDLSYELHDHASKGK